MAFFLLVEVMMLMVMFVLMMMFVVVLMALAVVMMVLVYHGIYCFFRGQRYGAFAATRLQKLILHHGEGGYGNAGPWAQGGAKGKVAGGQGGAGGERIVHQ